MKDRNDRPKARSKPKSKKKPKRKSAEELEAQTFTKRTGRIFQNQRRDAREAGVWLDYDASGLRKLVRRALDEAAGCPYCQGLLTVTNFSLDHKVPTSRSGGHSIVNLVVCCGNCNQAKGGLDHVEWRQLMQAMGSWSAPVRLHTIARLRAGGARMRSAPKAPSKASPPPVALPAPPMALSSPAGSEASDPVPEGTPW